MLLSIAIIHIFRESRKIACGNTFSYGGITIPSLTLHNHPSCEDGRWRTSDALRPCLCLAWCAGPVT